MSESKRPSFAQLADWIEGRLSPEGAADVAEQVAQADAATHADVAWLRAFTGVQEAIRFEDPPEAVRTLLVRQFAARRQARPQPGLLRRLVAALVFDSRGQPAAAGMRATSGHGLDRQLIYSAEIVDVALNVLPRPHDGTFDLIGQVFATADVTSGDFGVQLLRDAVEWGMTSPDPLGEFIFEAVPAGAYEIVLATSRFEVLIPLPELQL